MIFWKGYLYQVLINFLLTGDVGLLCAIFQFWIFPNLTEDVGFFDSFWPIYVYTYTKPKKVIKQIKLINNSYIMPCLLESYGSASRLIVQIRLYWYLLLAEKGVRIALSNSDCVAGRNRHFYIVELEP